MGKHRLMINEVPVDVERGEQGLIYATSPMYAGLLVAENSLRKVVRSVPKAVSELLETRRVIGDAAQTSSKALKNLADR